MPDKGATHIGDGAIAIVRQGLDEYGRTVGSIPLVHEFLETRALTGTAGAADNSPLDVVLGHVGLLGLVQDDAQTKVGVRIGATLSGGEGDLVPELGEYLAALGVIGLFGAPDGGPFAVTRHRSPPGDPVSTRSMVMIIPSAEGMGNER